MNRFYVDSEKRVSTRQGDDCLFCVDTENKKSLKEILSGKKETVWVYCYNNISLMGREEAFEYFKQGVDCCEGSEKSRYECILIQLKENRDVVVDNDYDDLDMLQGLMKSCTNWMRYQCETKDIVKSLIDDREGR